MGKRRADADTRRFFDQFESVRISRFRAMGIVDPSRPQAVIPFPGGSTKLLSVSHTAFPNGGGWSFFVCPKCAKRSMRLYLVDDAPLCWRCCEAINIRHAAKWGFGRAERLKASDRALDQLIAKLETTKPLRLKPAPPHWNGHFIQSRERKLTRLRKRMIALRLNQLASQQTKANNAYLKLTRAYEPRSDALMAIPELAQIWKARTHESLEQALDKAQVAILTALESSEPQQRMAAARLLFNTKQARDRGL
jgi:hypothetical protein